MSTTPPTARDPLVSWVICCRNGEPFLEASLRSVISQSYQNWEMILIDDGSTDQSGAIMHRISESDSRIRFIQQTNCGLTLSLRRGCALANGEFIARHDVDDVSLPDRLEKQVNLLCSRRDVGLVSCWTEYVGPNNEPLQVLTRPTDFGQATQGLLDQQLGPPAHGSVVFRKSLYEQVGGYRAEFYFAQDSDLWMRMAEKSLVAYVPEVLYRFRRHLNSITGSAGDDQAFFGEMGQACRAARRLGQKENLYLEQAAARCLLIRERKGLLNHDPMNQISESYFIGSQLYDQRDPRCRAYLGQVIRQQPTHWKAWIKYLLTYTR